MTHHLDDPTVTASWVGGLPLLAEQPQDSSVGVLTVLVVQVEEGGVRGAP